jgi:hypothetical protein
MGKDCKHPSGTWGDWFYLEGVTSGIMMRIKYCDVCGKQMDSQVKSV